MASRPTGGSATHGWGELGPRAVDALGPLSPELALVAPELRELARAFLPDRPWDAFARVAPPSSGPASGVDLLAKRPAPGARGRGGRVVAREAFRSARHLRPASVTGGLAVCAALALLVAGSLPVVRQAPTLLAADLRGQGTGGAVAGAGYVEEGLLAFRVGADGRTVLDVTVTTECGELAAPGFVQIEPDGRFDVQSRDGELTVSGVFDSPDVARGYVRASREGCVGVSRPFVAAVS